MALSIIAGTGGLLQLGLSISDIALCVDLGKKFGNFVRAGQNDNDLFEVLNEDREALFRRRGLVDAVEMEKRWPQVQFVHRGTKKKGNIMESPPPESPLLKTNHRKKREDTSGGVDRFTWIMVAIVSALDGCLPSSVIQELLIRVFVEVLAREDDIVPALRITIKKNVESWRSFGCARNVAFSIKNEMHKSLSNGELDQHPIQAIPQLNEAEMADAQNFLVWLLRGDSTVFSVMSPITFSIAEAWEKVKLDLCTGGHPTHEGQACVTYHREGHIIGGSSSSTGPIPRGLGSRPLQISWPRDRPESMIDVLGSVVHWRKLCYKPGTVERRPPITWHWLAKRTCHSNPQARYIIPLKSPLVHKSADGTARILACSPIKAFPQTPRRSLRRWSGFW
jgi:hypothetical protein